MYRWTDIDILERERNIKPFQQERKDERLEIINDIERKGLTTVIEELKQQLQEKMANIKRCNKERHN